MKKSKILTICLSTLCLFSCSTQYSKTPSGKELSVEDGKTKMKAAMQISDEDVAKDTGKLKIGIDDGYFKLTGDASAKTISDTSSASLNIDISKIKVLLTMEGLNSTNSDDYHSHLDLDLHGEMKATAKTSSSSNEVEAEKKEYDFDVYQNKTNIYFDFSGNDSLNLAKQILPFVNLNNGKVYLPNNNFSIQKDFSESEKNDDTTTSTNSDFSFEDLVLDTDEGVYLDTGNGNYAFTYTMNGDTLNSKLNAKYENTDTGIKYTISDESTLKYSIQFSETSGISSIGVDAKITCSYEIASSYYTISNTSSAKGNISIEMGTKFVFDTSSSINVDMPSDLSDYKSPFSYQAI